MLLSPIHGGKVQLLLKCENCGSFLGRAAVFVTVLCVYFKIEATGISSDSKESLKIRKGNFTGINLCLVNTGCFLIGKYIYIETAVDLVVLWKPYFIYMLVKLGQAS